MTWWQSLLTVLGSVLAAAVPAWFAYRASTRATEKSSTLQKDANAVSGYHQLVGDLRADIDRLRADHNLLAADHNRVKSHVVALEQQRIKDRALIRYLVTYAKQLRGLLRKHGIPIPELESGLDLDDPEMIPED